jgi:hypothetical protein
LAYTYTALSGVESQQDDAGVAAELVLVQRSKAAHPREQDADVQAPPHLLHVRITHLLEARWAAMAKGGGAYTQQGRAKTRRLRPDEAARPALLLHLLPVGCWLFAVV